MTSIRYFEAQVLRKRPYLTVDMCRSAVSNPLRREVQADGRIRHWSSCRTKPNRASCGS
jgi:hypothetical protein